MIFSFKDICGAREFGMLDPRLTNLIIPELAVVFDEVGVEAIVFTSVFRRDRSDHGKYRAVDIRVWALSIPRRHEVEMVINDKFPQPHGERATLKYWHPENSPINKYSPHFHLRVPVDKEPVGSIL
jgi:hypothetical protein